MVRLLDIVPPAVFFEPDRPRFAVPGFGSALGGGRCHRLERIRLQHCRMTSRPRSAHDRDRAIARLRATTRGSAVAGVIGTLLFGAVAAATYDGTSIQSAEAVADTTAAQIAAEDRSGLAAADDTSSTGSVDDQLQATTAPTSASSGTGHAATGGS